MGSIPGRALPVVAHVAVPAFAAWVLGATDARPLRRALYAGLVGLGCLLVLTPWWYRNYRIYGRLIPGSLAGTSGASVSPVEIEKHGVTKPP